MTSRPSTAIRSADAAAATPRRSRASEVWKIVAFLGIGGLCYVIDAGLLLLLAEVVGWPAWAAGTVGYVTSVVVNFLLNRSLFSQRTASSRLAGQTVRYLVLLGGNYLVTLAGLTLAEALGWNLLVAKTALVAVISVWNFFLYRRWVFRDR